MKLVSTLNDIEHTLQYVAALPHELDFEDDTRVSLSSYDSNGDIMNNSAEAAATAARDDQYTQLAAAVSINITGATGSSSQHNNNNNNSLYLADQINATCDYMDMIVYTVLETLQAKVFKK